MHSLEQQFHGGDGSLEIVVDPAGITAIPTDGAQRTIAWGDVAAMRYEPPRESIDLVAREPDATITVPFDMASEDGTFDDLLHTILYHAKCEGRLPDEEPAEDAAPARVIFGQWQYRRIAAWLLLAMVGGGAALYLLPQRGPSTLAFIVAALWLMAIYYAGLKRECRVVVTRSWCALHKLLSQRRYRFAELSNLGVRLENPRAARGRRLCLVVTPRAGWPEQITTLGSETLDAFFTLRQGIRSAPDEG